MTKYIALDDGHGMETSGKRTPAITELKGRVIRENEFNRAVVALTKIELERCGFKVLLTAPTDADTPLKARTDLANKAKVDLLVSFHYNAITGNFATSKAEGFSVHIDPSGGKSLEFANILIKHLANGTKQKNRGIVKQDLHITRETKMPSVLVEFGFMDNKREAMLMIDKKFQKECALEVAKAICAFYKVTYNAEIKNETIGKATDDSSDTIYRIVTGSFSSRIEAEKRMNELKVKGFDSFILPYKK